MYVIHCFLQLRYLQIRTLFCIIAITLGIERIFLIHITGCYEHSTTNPGNSLINTIHDTDEIQIGNHIHQSNIIYYVIIVAATFTTYSTI